MKNIYFVQPNYMLSDSAYLPYASGEIAAYSMQFPEISSEYCLKELFFLKEPFDDITDRLSEPYLVAFSSYMWNIEYNLCLAERIKRSRPDCIIVFGGPQIPDNTDYLEKHSFIDVLMHSEGESVFYNMLKALSEGKGVETVSNVSCRVNGEIIKTAHVSPCEIRDFPSPYVSGVFDSILDDERYRGIQLDAIVETNRGCPYKCAYCCWGANDAPLRKFPIERVKQELLWFASHKIAYVFCADANFGIFDRDEEIVDYLVELKNNYGYPEKFETVSAKDKDETTFSINKKLNSAGLNRGVSLACQSLSAEVLKNIGRKNMPFEFFAEQLKKYREAGIYTYTDLIIGLPGESYESFCRGFFSVIEAGQHYSINAYCCELLPNSALHQPQMVERYSIKTVKSHIGQNHSRTGVEDVLATRSEIVVETDTMSISDWKRCVRVSVCAQSFHCMGLLRFVAVFLRRAKGITYYDFYMNLFDWINNSKSIVSDLLQKVTGSVDLVVEGKGSLGFSDERFGDLYYAFDEGLFMCCVSELDRFYEQISVYLSKYFEDKDLFSDLMKYQKSVINKIDDHERKAEFKYDWKSYFANIFNIAQSLPDRRDTILVITPECVSSYKEYAKQIVWYGKRNDKMIAKSAVLLSDGSLAFE